MSGPTGVSIDSASSSVERSRVDDGIIAMMLHCHVLMDREDPDDVGAVERRTIGKNGGLMDGCAMSDPSQRVTK